MWNNISYLSIFYIVYKIYYFSTILDVDSNLITRFLLLHHCDQNLKRQY